VSAPAAPALEFAPELALTQPIDVLHLIAEQDRTDA